MEQLEEIQDNNLQDTGGQPSDTPPTPAPQPEPGKNAVPKHGDTRRERENDSDLQAYSDLVHDETVEMNNTKVYNALKMVSFILDNCIDYDKNLIANVFEARSKVNTKEWTLDAEIKFMDTYGKLVRLIQPVSVSSIATMTAAEKKSLSGVVFGKEKREKRKRRSTIWYSIITLLLLAILLGIQD